MRMYSVEEDLLIVRTIGVLNVAGSCGCVWYRDVLVVCCVHLLLILLSVLSHFRAYQVYVENAVRGVCSVHCVILLLLLNFYSTFIPSIIVICNTRNCYSEV